ncbi:neuronal-specific septin-3 isoform X2 [Syngnathoides biaculeatus]|uniref:neuronal-specific septin-3 isoform X2 n=1 Tax=Syngnathoides biaculeatus TaxID=300417 RepID=UPI002ADE0038|nr:neuronal-specific septin-3 isoform X2 [Syngnathoides biaculeatus]
MHPGRTSPATSAAGVEARRTRRIEERHPEEETLWTLFNTSLGDFEFEQDRSKTQTTRAPWRAYAGTPFQTSLEQVGAAPPNLPPKHNFHLDQELFDGPPAPERPTKTRREREDPYYASISYADAVYEDMSDIVPPEVRPKPVVPAKPPNVGAPSPSAPFPHQVGAGVSAPPPSAIPVPIGSHGGSHAVGGHGHGGGSALLGYIGIDAIIEQMRKKTMKTGFDFNIMVVGHSGLGKSTLVNTLFKSQVSRRSAGWSRDDKIPKTVEIKSVSHVIEEGGVKMKLTVVDTPGFGDLINNDNCWEPISKYINEQYEKFLKEEVNITRKKRIPDTRVHCCLYFISPTGHTLRQLDVEFMKRLSHSVNIIPVIAKADTMTPEERHDFKQRVKKELEMNGIEFYPQKEFDEDMEDKSDNDKIREAMPFAVVGSDKEYQVNGKRVLGRKTAWGVVEVENMNHCEFAQLRDFIIRSHLQDLKEVTHNIHYETYRAKRLHENGGLHPVDTQESNL